MMALLPATIAAGLIACNTGIHGDNSSSTPSLPPVQSGVFKDSNVAGLDYVSGSESGVTGADGGFRCGTGEPIQFLIGNVVLGETECATLAHPPALTASGSFSAPEALNVARLMLILDGDQDPENGIQISDELRGIASSWQQVDFGAADFPAELAQIISDIFVIEERLIHAPPTADDAFAHMEPGLVCAYSGVFVGSLPAPDIQNVGYFTLTVYRDEISGDDWFEFRGFRRGPFLLVLNVTGQVRFATLPTLASAQRDPLPSVSGRFVTPDRVTGVWDQPRESLLLNSRGNFSGTRIGGNAGQYRFVGGVSGAGSADSVVLNLDGDALSGEAFDVAAGMALQLTGTLSAVDDSIELDLEGADSTGTAQLLRDAAGRPALITGAWPDNDGASLVAHGCRLN